MVVVDAAFEVLEGWWTDAGTFDSLLHAASLVSNGGANHLEDGASGAS